MKRKFKKAYTALKKIGAPVFENEDMKRDGNFGMSAKNNYDRIWADYYREWHPIDAEVLKIVDKNGLYFEWQNPDVLYAFEK